MSLIDSLKQINDLENNHRYNQFYPSKVRVVPNDKATKLLFSRSGNVFKRLMNGEKFTVKEKDTPKKKINSSFTLENQQEYNNQEPLTEFDRAVLSVCISEWIEGNKITTPAIILRALIGKVGDQNVRPRANQKAAIDKSIEKLMFTKFNPDVEGAYAELNYPNGDFVKIKKSPILPCYTVEACINGQKIDAVIFDRESPLFTIANIKSQFIRFDNSLLDVPNQENTPRIITVKNYVLLRIAEIINHKMTPTLTFNDIFAKCRIEDKHGEIKARARENIIQFFEHLQAQGVINSFEIVKKHNAFYSIKFSYEKNAKILLKNAPKKDAEKPHQD